MKRLFFLLFSTMSVLFYAQKTLKHYQYWYDGDFSKAILTNISNPVEDIQAVFYNSYSLSKGLHDVTFRTQDSDGKWSATTRDFFYITPNYLVEAQYWMDDDFTRVFNVANTNQTIYDLNKDLFINFKDDQLHKLNFRAKDVNGTWSSVSSSYFLGSGDFINGYEYWYDVYAPAFTILKDISPTSNINVLENASTQNLILGNHTLFFRAKDTNGKWSSVISQSFTKTQMATNETAEKLKINIYPNPVATKLFVKSQEKIISIEVFDVSGKIVNSINLNNLDYEFDTKNLSAGIYLIKVNTEKNSKTLKIIKK